MFGTMKAGGLEVPVDAIRLVGGEIEFSGEVRSTWRRPIRSSGGPVHVSLYGPDGQQVAPLADWSVEVPEIERGGSFRVIMSLRPDADSGTWMTVRRLAEELPPPRQAITSR
jgi:hypothetical protein